MFTSGAPCITGIQWLSLTALYVCLIGVCFYCWSNLIANKLIHKYYIVDWNLSWEGFEAYQWPYAIYNLLELSYVLQTNKYLSWCWNIWCFFEKKCHYQSVIDFNIRMYNSSWVLWVTYQLPRSWLWNKIRQHIWFDTLPFLVWGFLDWPSPVVRFLLYRSPGSW